MIENFRLYEKYTNENRWEDICRLNQIDFDSFGTKKELNRLQDFLEPEEVVLALTSGIMKQTQTSNAFDFGTNTWLVTLTNERFLFLDAAMLTKSIDSQSIRLDKVQAVSASQGFMFGKIMIDLGNRMIEVDNCNKHTVPPFVELCNKLLREEKIKSTSTPINEKSNYIDKLEDLWKLNSFGAISDDEYEKAKSKLINSDEFQKFKKKLLESIE